MSWWEHLIAIWVLGNMAALAAVVNGMDAMQEHQLEFQKSSFTATAMVDLVTLTAIAFVFAIIWAVVS